MTNFGFFHDEKFQQLKKSNPIKKMKKTLLALALAAGLSLSRGIRPLMPGLARVPLGAIGLPQPGMHGDRVRGVDARNPRWPTAS